MGWFSEQIKQRKENDQKVFEDSFNDLAGMKNDDEQTTREDFIVSQLAKYFGAEKLVIPSNIKGLSGKIDYTIESLGVYGRKVTLSEGWYLDNREPLLVFSKEDNTPILLLPKGQRHYYFVSFKTGKKIVGTVAMAKKLKKQAFAFYKPIATNKLTLTEYWKFFRKSIRAMDLVLVSIISIIAIAIGMVAPYLTKTLTGQVVQEENLNLFAAISIFLVSVGIVYILIKATQAFMNARVTVKVEKATQESTMVKLLSLPVAFFKQYSTGELASRFHSISLLGSLLFNGIFLTTITSVFSLAYVVQIVQFAPSLILPVILILALTTTISISVSVIHAKVSRRQMMFSAKENGTTYSLLSGIQKIRLAGAEKRAFAKWAKDYSTSSELLYHPPLIIRLYPMISLLILLIGAIIIYIIASKNNVDTSSFMAFTASYASLSAAVSMLSEIGNTISRIKPVLEMARPILEAESEDDENKEKIEHLNGDIKLENVSFRYNSEGRMVLDDLTIHVKEGEYIGIVGKTGCGKSTLVRLLLGFEKPLKGKIFYDDKDIDTLNLQSLRSKIGSVTQNGGVFHADIKSNILITALDLEEKDAWDAAEIAGIAEDIRNMPMKMNTVISEGQGGISGGQKQRIMIARAIVHKPKVLIFDEATSALDNKTQKSISESINKLNCTRIVIAHRLSTIKHCDRILFMEDGKIVEEGTYDELIALNGKFKELIERQKLE